jgi:hydrogenase expression/formation protein HypE
MPLPLLPIGKLPPDLLIRLLAGQPSRASGVIVGPGLGLDCAVVEPGGGYLVLKSDPITFASDQIGWYAVQVNANDIATTGATPRWFMATVLLPARAAAEMAERILGQIAQACRALDVAVVGGHTEVTRGLDRPIVAGTMLGQVEPGRLLTPRGARPGDDVLVTKSVPIEGAAILARELPDRLRGTLTDGEIDRAAGYLTLPGISVVADARVALAAGRVTSMHDPTEGGLASALWELATASGRTIRFDPRLAPIDGLARRICAAFDLDPLATIASGALLLTVSHEDTAAVREALAHAGIPSARVGTVDEGPARVVIDDGRAAVRLLAWPARDEIGKAFE